MITVVTGLLAHAIAVVFLGWLAYSIASVPLAIVIAAGVACMLVDFVRSVQQGEFRG